MSRRNYETINRSLGGTMAMVATLLAGSLRVQVQGGRHFNVPAHRVMDLDPPTPSCRPLVVLQLSCPPFRALPLQFLPLLLAAISPRAFVSL